MSRPTHSMGQVAFVLPGQAFISFQPKQVETYLLASSVTCATLFFFPAGMCFLLLHPASDSEKY